MGWRKVRDWEVAEAVSSLEEDSYDLVGRDIPIKGVEDRNIHFLRYESNDNFVEARFYYSDFAQSRNNAYFDLSAARDALNREGFRYRLSLSSSETARPGYEPQISGSYSLDLSADVEELDAELSGLLDWSLEDLDEIRVSI